MIFPGGFHEQGTLDITKLNLLSLILDLLVISKSSKQEINLNQSSALNTPWNHWGQFQNILLPGSPPQRSSDNCLICGLGRARFKKSPGDFNSPSRLRTNDAAAQELDNHFNNIALCPRNELYLNKLTSAAVKGATILIQSFNPEQKPIQLECRKQGTKSCLVCQVKTSGNQKPGSKP